MRRNTMRFGQQSDIIDRLPDHAPSLGLLRRHGLLPTASSPARGHCRPAGFCAGQNLSDGIYTPGTTPDLSITVERRLTIPLAGCAFNNAYEPPVVDMRGVDQQK